MSDTSDDSPVYTLRQYEQDAMRTRGGDDSLSLELLQESANRRLLNAALGMAGEAGEAADMVKKWIFHGKGLDRVKLIKELGDVLWYVTQAADALNVSLETVANLNIEKLRLRYPDGFTHEAARARADEMTTRVNGSQTTGKSAQAFFPVLDIVDPTFRSPLDGSTPKYVVYKNNNAPPCATCGRSGTPVKPEARYLVLRVDTDDRSAKAALAAYLQDLRWSRDPDKLRLYKHLTEFFRGHLL